MALFVFGGYCYLIHIGKRLFLLQNFITEMLEIFVESVPQDLEGAEKAIGDNIDKWKDDVYHLSKMQELDSHIKRNDRFYEPKSNEALGE